MLWWLLSNILVKSVAYLSEETWAPTLTTNVRQGWKGQISTNTAAF
jgi:hypothetical protein